MKPSLVLPIQSNRHCLCPMLRHENRLAANHKEVQWFQLTQFQRVLWFLFVVSQAGEQYSRGATSYPPPQSQTQTKSPRSACWCRLDLNHSGTRQRGLYVRRPRPSQLPSLSWVFQRLWDLVWLTDPNRTIKTRIIRIQAKNLSAMKWSLLNQKALARPLQAFGPKLAARLLRPSQNRSRLTSPWSTTQALESRFGAKSHRTGPAGLNSRRSCSIKEARVYSLDT